MKKKIGISVTLKAAISIDGKIATATGESKWITSEDSRRKAHQLRAQNDGILVGINTILADDPRLTVRDIKTRNSPFRIVLDSNARIPNQSRVFENDGVPVIIITGNKALSRKWPKLSELIILKAPSEQPEVFWVLSELRKLGIRRLLIEGGSMIFASFLKSNCIDEVALFIAPKIIGGQKALSWCGDLKVNNLENVLKLEITSTTLFGEDLLILGKFK